MQQLLRAMICPDSAYRISAMQAYHHPALQPDADPILTPHFVRAAAEYIPPPPLPQKRTAVSDERNRRAKKKEKSNKENRAPTPALGESIRQHTSMPMLRAEVKNDKGKQKQKPTASPKKKDIVIKSNQKLLAEAKGKDEDPTRELICASNCDSPYVQLPNRPSRPKSYEFENSIKLVCLQSRTLFWLALIASR